MATKSGNSNSIPSPLSDVLNVADLIPQIVDPKVREATVACMAILAGGELERDFKRGQKQSLAMLYEWKREVSPGLLNAMVINMIAGARMTRTDEKLLVRLFKLLQNDPSLVDLMLQISAYAELLAPAAKRVAEDFIAAQQKGRK